MAGPHPGVSVITADDHPIYREGLARAIAERPELRLVGEVTNGRDALAVIRDLQPDVALMDVMMPEMTGTQVLGCLLAEESPTRVVLISAQYSSSLVFETMSAGAWGFLPKDAERHCICDALVAAARGEATIPPKLQTGLVDELRRRASEDGPVLTLRERQVLALTAEGLSRQEIGDRLFLSPHTIKSHLQCLYGKLGVSDRAALIAEAMRRGLLA